MTPGPRETAAELEAAELADLKDLREVVAKYQAEKARADRLEKALGECVDGIGQVEAQASLCLNHVGVLPRQQEWARHEVSVVAKQYVDAARAALYSPGSARGDHSFTCASLPAYCTKCGATSPSLPCVTFRDEHHPAPASPERAAPAGPRGDLISREAVARGVAWMEQAETLEATLKALVQRLDLVHDADRYRRVWQIAQLHDGEYDGPKYENELNRARSVLAALDATAPCGPPRCEMCKGKLYPATICSECQDVAARASDIIPQPLPVGASPAQPAALPRQGAREPLQYNLANPAPTAGAEEPPRPEPTKGEVERCEGCNREELNATMPSFLDHLPNPPHTCGRRDV